MQLPSSLIPSRMYMWRDTYLIPNNAPYNTTHFIHYEVIRISLRDFRPLRYSSRDGHAEGEHVNTGRYNPSFCPTLQVQLARCVDFWGFLTNVSRTRWRVSADGPCRLVHFAAHRQPLLWNFMYRSWIVLSVSGSVWYMVRNLRCTVKTDLVLANSKTTYAFLFLVHSMFRHDCPLAVKPASTPPRLEQKYLERFCTFW
jgi:hypothetical protein